MRLNTQARPATQAQTYEGTPAKRISDEQALRRAVVSCLLWEDQFYESGETIAGRIKQLALTVSPPVAASIARDARVRHKLRHVPLWIARALAGGTIAQKAEVASLLDDIIQRPDELTEFLALYWKGGRTPLAACVKRGLARAFPKFSAYQLAKYNRAAEVRLRDVLFLVHAKPISTEQAETWKQLVNGTLAAPDTWEVALSAGGDKRIIWTRLLSERKLGALALLRNLRNMIEVKVEDALIADAILTASVDRILPFRFIAAAQHAPRFEAELEQTMFRCVAEEPKLAGHTALVVDTSPSMWHAKISERSDLDRFDAAAALAILCAETCERTSIYAFNERAYEVPSRRGFALRDALAQTKGSASCGGLAVSAANTRGYDRIIVLTDGQWHYPNQSKTYWQSGDAVAVAPAPLTEKAYMVNVAAYRHAVGGNKWHTIDGWSEGILDYIRASEQDLA